MKTSAYLRPPARSKECTISVRYTHKHKYFAVRTGLSVLPIHFDDSDGTIRRSHTNHLLMNGIISQRKSELMSVALQLLLRGTDPTIDRVQEALKNGISPLQLVQPTLPIIVQPDPTPAPILAQVIQSVTEVSKPITEVSEVVTKVSRRTVKARHTKSQFHELLALYSEGSVHDAASTKKDKKLFLKVVAEFQAWYGRPLEFENMDGAFYGHLAKYFLEERGGYNNVFGKRIKEIKAFLRWCEVEQNVVVKQAYRKWKVYHEEKEIVYLTEDEIDLFWHAQDLTTQMQKYRDVFVFSCLTGFRWSDIIRSKQMVVQNGLLTILTQKNRGNAKVPMNERIQAILDRYNGDLNIVTLQNLNESIKMLAQKLGMDDEVYYYRYKLKEAVSFHEPKWKLLSAHCGRRSFITNAFTKGFAVPEIMEMIGSSDARVLQGYMAITGSHLVEKTKRLS